MPRVKDYFLNVPSVVYQYFHKTPSYWEKAILKQACKIQASLFFLLYPTDTKLFWQVAPSMYRCLFAVAVLGSPWPGSQQFTQVRKPLLGNTGPEDGSGTSQL